MKSGNCKLGEFYYFTAPMKDGIKTRSGILALALLSASIFFSCDKSNDGFIPQGGQLPTRYVTIRDTAIIPSILTISVGNSITFLNQTATPKSVVSQDSATILSGPIPAGSFYFWKKDTTGTFEIHLTENPLLRSTIVIVP